MYDVGPKFAPPGAVAIIERPGIGMRGFSARKAHPVLITQPPTKLYARQTMQPSVVMDSKSEDEYDVLTSTHRKQEQHQVPLSKRPIRAIEPGSSSEDEEADYDEDRPGKVEDAVRADILPVSILDNLCIEPDGKTMSLDRTVICKVVETPADDSFQVTMNGDASPVDTSIKPECESGAEQKDPSNVKGTQESHTTTALEDDGVSRVNISDSPGLNIGIDELDSDVESINQSLFSDGQTSVTPQISWKSGTPSIDASDQFVTLPLAQQELKSLCTKAINSSATGPDRFVRNFRRLLKSYGTALKKESKKTSTVEQVAANFIIQRARYVSVKIRQLCDYTFSGGKLRLPENTLDKRGRVNEYLKGLDGRNSHAHQADIDAGSSGSEDDTDLEDNGKFFHLATVQSFMIKSNAFAMFCSSLARFVEPTWETRLRDLVTRYVEQKHINGATQEDLERVKFILADLHDIPAHSVSVHDSIAPSRVESLQRQMERRTKTQWDWWPFAMPRQDTRD